MVGLRALGVPGARRLLAGSRARRWAPDYPGTDDLLAATRLLWAHEHVGDLHPFGAYQLVHDGVVVGHAGFHGPPSQGEVEIGYAVVPSARGQGVATVGVRLLLAVAAAHGARSVRAHVHPGNAVSLAVLRAAGLRRGADVDGMAQLTRRLEATDAGLRSPASGGPARPSPPPAGG